MPPFTDNSITIKVAGQVLTVWHILDKTGKWRKFFMKATGIVRRIDDLGRVVVPKEIRRTLHIREGDPLEIFTDREGGIVLRKYSPIGELSGFAKQYAEALAQASGHIVSITDRDQHIAVSGHGKKELLGKAISKELEKVVHQRNMICCQWKDKAFVPLVQEGETEFKAQVICPIIAEGDAIGAVILTSRDEQVKMGEVEQKLASAAASFMGRQMEQ